MNHLRNFIALLLLSLPFWWPAGATGQAISALPNTNRVKTNDLFYLVVTNNGAATNFSYNVRFDQIMTNLMTNGFLRTNSTMNINPTQFTYGGLGLTITNNASLTNPQLASAVITLQETLVFTGGTENWNFGADSIGDFLKIGNDTLGDLLRLNSTNLFPFASPGPVNFSLGSPSDRFTAGHFTDLAVYGSITNLPLADRLVWADSLGVLRPVTNISGGSFTNGTLTVTGGSSSGPTYLIPVLTALTNSAVETDMVAVTITNNTFTTGKTLRISTYFDYFKNTGGAENTTNIVKFNGTKIFQSNAGNVANSANVRGVFVELFVYAVSSSSQVTRGTLTFYLGGTATVGSGDTANSTLLRVVNLQPTDTSIDMTSGDKVIAFSANFSAANANLYYWPRWSTAVLSP